MFQTILTIVSFPFWFFGGVFFLGSLFGTLKINNRRANIGERIIGTIISAIVLIVAYLMVNN